MSHDYHQARAANLPDAAIRLPALDEFIEHVVGDTATLISRETGMSLVALSVEAGSIRLKPGDYTATLTATVPPETTYLTSGDEGDGGLLLSAGDANQPSAVYILPMPDELTVVGSAAGAVLTFWFLP